MFIRFGLQVDCQRLPEPLERKPRNQSSWVSARRFGSFCLTMNLAMTSVVGQLRAEEEM
jgi:hypothetical protein